VQKYVKINLNEDKENMCIFDVSIWRYNATQAFRNEGLGAWSIRFISHHTRK
jgi:hypothetical protein